ncbi:MAG: hypothetical protein A2Y07_02525 [Planctomycetes bacterium GWF2_50_10]|nr:MAG: hypothetical protein A2Y07_02525 [Planctomycetes bacterium GWF2_50_10]
MLEILENAWLVLLIFIERCAAVVVNAATAVHIYLMGLVVFQFTSIMRKRDEARRQGNKDK